MHASRLLVPAVVRGGLALVAGLAILLGAAAPPAAAASFALAPVPLGTHRFGHLRAPDATAPAPAPPAPTGPRVDSGGMTAPTVTAPPAQPATAAADPAAARSALGRWLPWLVGMAASALVGLGLWLLYRRRHPTGPGPHGRSGVAS